jgi:hypothetical protein
MAPGNGGNGVSSSVTGSAVTRGGGGAGQGATANGTGGNGGGGGSLASGSAGTSGTVNTGGGGGGSSAGRAGGGGSGIVILKYLSTYNITVSAGLTSSTSTVGSYKVTQITAGTGTVSWS